MRTLERYQKELTDLAQGVCQYGWDELEEMITDDFEEEKLTSEEFDHLMELLMNVEPE